ncbi:hypothetical protein CLU96_3302 [Chryseobacterium sp. 52]|nr:hypothetical protein CLU96_3302 [Chryseobacterium sp. 52]
MFFNTITFDSFKVNIVERYTGSMNFHPKLCEVLFKVRTLDDGIVKRKDVEQDDVHFILSLVISHYNLN